MKLVLSLISSLFIFPVLSSAQSNLYYVSNDKSYHVFLPSGWEKKDNPSTNRVFIYAPTDQGKAGFMPTTIQLETGTLKEGYQNADITEIARLESAIMKEQSGSKIDVFKDSIRMINNKAWWEYAFSTKGPKKTKATYYILKTIHNKVTYTLTFSAPDENFDKYMSTAINNLQSFMFYTTDETLYKNKKQLDAQNLAKWLSTYEGTYKEQIENYTHTITIKNSGNGNYLATENREFLVDGKKISFIADLLIENIGANEIVLSSDKISACDLSKNWKKGFFTLRNTASSLSGSLASKGAEFDTYNINLKRQKDVASTNSNTASKPTDGKNTQKSEQGPISQPESNAPKTYGTAHSETSEIDEPKFIKQFGLGKIVRKSKTELVISTTTKSVVLKDKGGESDDTKVRYKFLGTIAALNSFVVYVSGIETDAYILINKVNGSMVQIPNLEYVMSADKKWIAVFNNDIMNSLEESFVKIFSVSINGLKESFSKVTFDVQTNSGWGANTLVWKTNDILEIDVVTADPATEELKPAGKVWVMNQSGKWVPLSAPPDFNSVQNTIMPSATELPMDDGTNAGTGKPTLVPNASARILTGGKTPEELGQMLLTALKNNDKKAWYKCILNGTAEEAEEDFDFVRNRLKLQGLTNWNLVKFSRVKYSEIRSNGKISTDKYQYYVIEFTYGADFIGVIKRKINTRIELYNQKYVLENSLDAAALVRKEEYR
jgi:hypothetical protein